jgi:RHS repeat-associated protein
MTSWVGNTVNWTSYNYPSFIADGASGESVTFSYGPNRTPWLEATQEPSGTTETYRVGRLMSMVNSGSGLAYRNYIYAGNDPVAVDTITSSGETLQYFETGPQRSIDAITNSAGQVLVNESFSAYGVRRDPTTWSGAASSADLATSASITQHGYTFQRALGEEMNLNDMVGRVEDAGIGRFMSADPTIPHPSDPQSYNRYSYTRNDPLTYVDPTGFGDGDLSCPISGPTDISNIAGGKGMPGVCITATGNNWGSGSGWNGFHSPPPGSFMENGQGWLNLLNFGGGSPGGSGSNYTHGCRGSVVFLCNSASQPQGSPPSTTLQTIVVTPTYVLPDSGAVQQAGFAGLDFLGSQFLGYVQNEILGAIGCKRAACGVLATIVIAAVAPEAAEGGMSAEATQSEFTLTRTVENNIGSRPYLNSPLTIQEIQSTGLGVADPGGLPDALRYDVPGSFNDSNGTWQLVIDPNTGTVYHFLFTSGK